MKKTGISLAGMIFRLLLISLATVPTIRSAAADSSSLIREVSLERTMIDVGQGEETHIRYVLTGDAMATIQVFDMAQQSVRTIAEGKPSFKGANTVAWDGRTDAGKPAQDGAYTLRIVCRESNETETVYDPVFESGGESIVFPPQAVKFDAAAGLVRFQLMQPARVQIRAGVQEGPLLKAILDWQPFDAGEHEAPWDGKDSSGIVDVPSLPDWQLIARAFALPDNAIIVKGGGAPASSADIVEPEDALKTGVVSEAARRRSLIGASLSGRRTESIAPHAYVSEDRRILPEFEIEIVGAEIGKDAQPMEGNVPIRVTLGEETRRQLQRQRFEIVVYVDYQLVGEQEQGYSPYTYILDTTPWPDGKRVVTINVAGMEDQLNARSLVLDVLNEKNK